MTQDGRMPKSDAGSLSNVELPQTADNGQQNTGVTNQSLSKVIIQSSVVSCVLCSQSPGHCCARCKMQKAYRGRKR